MLININDLDRLKNLNLHDYYFDNFFYDYYDNSICICIKESNNAHKIQLNNVIFYKMQACAFWHSPYEISGLFTYKWNESAALKEIADINQKNNFDSEKLEDISKYFEINIEFLSGDRLTVLCSEIDINGTFPCLSSKEFLACTF